MTTTRLRGLTRTLGLNPRRRTASDGGSGPPGDTDAPSIPANLVATAVSSAQIDLTWNASSDNIGVGGYRIYRDNVLVDTSPTNAYADTGLDPGIEYEYEVSAFDAASNESARSAPDSATTHQVIVAAGLLAEWRFDEGSGQTVTDYTGNGHSGRLGSTAGADANDPDWDSMGLDFSAGTADWVEFDNAGISGGAARTLIVVFRRDATADNAWSFEWWANATAGTKWLVKQASGPVVRMEFNSGSYHSGLAPVAGWNYVAITQSGANRNTITIYLNGSSEAVTGSQTLNTQGTFKMGTANGTPLAATDKGVAYGLVYDRALSAAEVEQNRQALTSVLAARGITLPS